MPHTATDMTKGLSTPEKDNELEETLSLASTPTRHGEVECQATNCLAGDGATDKPDHCETKTVDQRAQYLADLVEIVEANQTTINLQNEHLRLLEERLSLATETMEDYKKTIDNQDCIMDQATAKLQSYRDRLDGAAKVVTLANANEKNERGLRRDAEQKNKKLTLEVEKLKKEAKRSAATICRLEKTIENMKAAPPNDSGPGSKIHQLETENRTLKQEIANAMEARDTHTKLKERVQNLKDSLCAAETTGNDFKKETIELRALVKDADMQLVALKRENSVLTAQLTQTTTDKEVLQDIAFKIYESIQYQRQNNLREALQDFEDTTGLAIIVERPDRV